MRKISNQFNIRFIFLAFLLTIATSCSPDFIAVAENNERGQIVSYAHVGTMTPDEIVSNSEDEGDISNYVEHTVDIYTVVYNSIEKGEHIEVSGLVMVPQRSDASFSVVQYHHGTIMPSDKRLSTPSRYKGNANFSSELYFIGSTVSSNGYVVSFPDYVGYGVSKEKEHPYTHHHELAEVSVDMLRATKQLLSILELNNSNEVFLTGWSEGGGAGLAVHRYLEQKYPDEFDLKGSSLFAGPYDWIGFVRAILDRKAELNYNVAIYSWGIYALNEYTPSLQKNASDIWSYSVTDQEDAINVPNDYTPEATFTEVFINSVLDSTNTDFITAAELNSLIEGWTPTKNIYFHSGTADDIVDHLNSVNAYNKFKADGTAVELYEYSGGDHYTPLFDYVTKTIDDFNGL